MTDAIPTATPRVATATATASPSPTPEPTSTPEPETPAPEPEPTETPEPEPTATPEPEPTETPEPTATPTPTPEAPTAAPTVSVALGVVITPPPVATPASTPSNPRTASPTAVVVPLPFTGSITGEATPYWDGLAGNTMGCGGIYSPDDTTVVAVGPAYYASIPCGTPLKVCGPAGCVDAFRTDSCPGCLDGHIVDMSRKGFDAVCGETASRCNVTVTRRQ